MATPPAAPELVSARVSELAPELVPHDAALARALVEPRKTLVRDRIVVWHQLADAGAVLQTLRQVRDFHAPAGRHLPPDRLMACFRAGTAHARDEGVERTIQRLAFEALVAHPATPEPDLLELAAGWLGGVDLGDLLRAVAGARAATPAVWAAAMARADEGRHVSLHDREADQVFVEVARSPVARRDPTIRPRLEAAAAQAPVLRGMLALDLAPAAFRRAFRALAAEAPTAALTVLEAADDAQRQALARADVLPMLRLLDGTEDRRRVIRLLAHLEHGPEAPEAQAAPAAPVASVTRRRP